MGFFFVQNFFFWTTRELEFLYVLSRKAQIFFRNLTLVYMTKTLNQVFFFSSAKIRIFFQQHWESEYVFRKNTDSTQQKEDSKGGGGEKLEQVFLFCFCFCVADYRRYNLYFIVCSSAVILQCLKDFYQEYSQKNNLFLEPIILKTTKAPFQTPHLWQTWWHKLCPRPHICVTDCNSTIHNR